MKLVRSILALALLTAGFAAAAAPVTYTLDPAHTQVLFSWDHLGFSNPTGQFDQVTGTLVYDAADPARSSVQVSISAKSLDTHVPALDRALQKADFLDTSKYPVITFVSSKVTVLGKNSLKVVGDLDVHGVTQPVTLDVTLNKSGMYPMINAPALGFAASTSFDRSAFGVGGGVPMVGDALQVRISAEAIEAQAFAARIAPLEKAAR